MAYRLNPENPLSRELVRVAREQIEGAIKDIHQGRHDIHEAVHDVRRHCKLIRGLIRLVRPAFPEYRSENAWFRDLGRSLSATRDATASIECLDALDQRFAGLIQPGLFAPVRRSLEQRRESIIASVKLDDRLVEARHSLYAAHWRAGDWSLEADGFEAVAGGLRKTYGRARNRMLEAREEAHDELLHEWRKRVKYHRYHMKLLGDIWPAMVGCREKECHRLTDYLGDDHDLVVLRDTLLGEPDRFGDPQTLRYLLGLIRWRRAELQAAAMPLGMRLFAETPDALVQRFSGTWAARLAETPEAFGIPAKPKSASAKPVRLLNAV
ncbi:MAG: CHAD domain-containing protein [Gammaproteobacteria bacterium]|jgi:CHAD domain-containing protein